MSTQDLFTHAWAMADLFTESNQSYSKHCSCLKQTLGFHYLYNSDEQQEQRKRPGERLRLLQGDRCMLAAL